ncbi:MAG: DUF86 domain-containing protein [Clostridia bacterium]|nr:DUF86 domain-containing protein [Clostridia bacterium]
MVNLSFLERKLSRLVEYIDDLDEQKGITLADWQSNKILRNHIERTLHKAVETCLDIGKHVIVSLRLRTPDDYKDIMVILTEANILPKERLGRYVKMAQFRNVIVHDYDDIDPVIVFAVLRKDLDDLRFFAHVVKNQFCS